MKIFNLKFLILFFCICLITARTLADGPPIHNGQISVPYVSLKLSDEQVKQAGIYRYIELSVDQKAALQKIAKTNIPNMLMIITAPYNDCSCGLYLYGLWAKKNEVQIPKSDLEYLHEVDGLDDSEIDLYKLKSMDEVKKEMSPTELNIDLSGTVYQKGIVVNNLNNALSILAAEARKSDASDEKYVWVNTPPFIDNQTQEKTKTAFINIKKFFSEKGYEVYAYFENEYINNVSKGYNKLPTFDAEPTKVDLSKLNTNCFISCETTWNVNASSYATWKNNKYLVSYLADTLLTTAWVEGMPGHGIDEKITFSNFKNRSGKSVFINGFLIANGFQKSKELFVKNSRIKSFVLLLNDEPKYLLNFSDAMNYQKITFPTVALKPEDTLTLKIIDVYGGVSYQDTGISFLVPYYE